MRVGVCVCVFMRTFSGGRLIGKTEEDVGEVGEWR